MHRLFVIILMCVYTLGSMLFPVGTVVNLTETYKQCQVEDPDLDVADFVFEHLLNFPEIGRPENGENEKPHQPLQHFVSTTLVVLSITSPIRIQSAPMSFPESVTCNYPLFNEAHLPSQYLSQVFHPPIV